MRAPCVGNGMVCLAGGSSEMGRACDDVDDGRRGRRVGSHTVFKRMKRKCERLCFILLQPAPAAPRIAPPRTVCRVRPLVGMLAVGLRGTPEQMQCGGVQPSLVRNGGGLTRRPTRAQPAALPRLW